MAHVFFAMADMGDQPCYTATTLNFMADIQSVMFNLYWLHASKRKDFVFYVSNHRHAASLLSQCASCHVSAS